ncbi:amidohydrolase [Leucobacter sp. wl10]|uniref:amidohydrolase n=1 Tax=Leucobacter sp. wl10 TaxID=2304677 RepID=UPI000E5AE35C|nr:amidohydrolase [Leucobacter sp. wl10]RGE17640.1 amidohydrolase [Leucobacter sp. wl10]
MAYANPGVTVFRDGVVFTARSEEPIARAVAVENGTIAAVGDEQVAPYLARAEEVVELGDRLLLPGFIDAHAHPIRAGIERLRCNLLDETTLSGYQRRIGEYAAAHPEQSWIIGGGWAAEAFPAAGPHREHIDAVVADRPVCLPDHGHHSMWVNTLALRLAGIDEHTPDPADGRIERDEDGRPTGLLHEGAGKLVERLAPEETEADYDAALREAQRYLHSCGIVGWQDAMVLRPGVGAASHETYLRGQAAGWLTARVVGALWWERDCPVELIVERVAELAAARDSAAALGSGYSARSVKIMLDGVVETGTASLLEPYHDRCGHDARDSGLSFIDPETLRAVVEEIDRAGLQAHFHALGDRAVRDALDAVERAQLANGTGDRRHQIAHLQLVDPSDIPRFEQLGVIANLQGLWAGREAGEDDLTRSQLGAVREDAQFPYGRIHRSGAPLAMGSDWPVSPADPLAAVHATVNRTLYGAPPGIPPLGVDEQVPLAAALTAFTAGSAWANHDDAGGSIRVGNRADLVVLDRNPLELPASEIGGCRVERTYVGGALVHQNGA